MDDIVTSEATPQGAEGDSATAPSSASSEGRPSGQREAKCVIVLGMAGSGKTVSHHSTLSEIEIRNL